MDNKKLNLPVKEALDLTYEFPKYLKRLRTLLNLSQKELGDILGVPQYNISRWEKGTRMPDDISIFNLIILWLQELELGTNGSKGL
jgi:transcriptional regulator with XRE-family HTH domain